MEKILRRGDLRRESLRKERVGWGDGKGNALGRASEPTTPARSGEVFGNSIAPEKEKLFEEM